MDKSVLIMNITTSMEFLLEREEYLQEIFSFLFGLERDLFDMEEAGR